MKTCECGCGQEVSGRTRNGDRRFITHHNFRVLGKTAEHCRNISDAQKRAWATKRKRTPIGAKWKDAGGYIRVKVAEGKGRWKLEHVLVMEASLNRPLANGEIVHHINGVRDDNRRENLFLCRDNTHHMQVEHSLVLTFRELLVAGVVCFNHQTGLYEKIL